MLLKLDKRKRDEKGHFLKTSKLSKKNFGVRLYEDDYPKIVKIAEAQGVRPTELVRLAVNQWLAELDADGEEVNFRQPIAV